ncbi:hypothetical protein pwc_24 [Weissella phage PWc]|nr:hypothetical protein pwc_24 [Weissella phage PWc]
MDKRLYDDEGYIIDASPRRNMVAFDIGKGMSVAEVSQQNSVRLEVIYQWFNEPDFVDKVEGQRNEELNDLIYGTGLQAMGDIIRGEGSDRARVDAYKNIIELKGSETRMLSERLKNEKLVREMRGENADTGVAINITLPNSGGENE